ncbi:MAG: hypothetical protein R6V50_06370 [Thermoplasmatota archaeon]
MKKRIIFVVLSIMFLVLSSTGHSSFVKNNYEFDFDPLVDIEVTVEINTIRYLEDESSQSTQAISTAKNRLRLFFEYTKWQINKNRFTDEKPSMYVKVFINNVEFTSPVYHDTYYVYDANFSATLDVPDDVEFVDITIQLWKKNIDEDILLDISPIKEEYEANMIYSIATGHWTGDDYLGDKSGYGRLNGCDDGSVYKNEGDCEIWFNIYQNTYDDSGIPYWMQVYVYGIDPMQNNTGIDYNGNGIPLEWEWKWGYDPFEYVDQNTLDPSGDAITNYEKYLTRDYGSDPFRKEIFVQMDVMEEGPNGEKTQFPDGGIELLTTAFNRQNVVLHLDTGRTVPFYEELNWSEIRNIYHNYFIIDEEERWRENVFHYGLIIYDVTEGTPPGFAFYKNAFVVVSQAMEEYHKSPFLSSREVIYASAFMHELGHTFGFWPIPGHNRRSIYPWQLMYWRNLPYNSCMNYGWMYIIVDYSDGSGVRPDIDDWQRINYHYFKS